MSRTAAIILAAGRSSRYRQAGGVAATKLVAELGGIAIVRQVAAAALASRAHPVVVVTGYAQAEVEVALAGLALDYVHNPDYAAGLSGSLRRGLTALPADISAALILLGDMPLITPAMIDALIETGERDPGAQAVVPVQAGVRGNPVLLGRSLFAGASRLSGDEGARKLLRDPSLRVVEQVFETEAVRLDLDDPATFARLEQAAPDET